MKFHTGLVFASCLSLGLVSYACVNGDTVQNGATGSGGSPSGNTGGSNGNTGGNSSSTGGNSSSTGGNSSSTGGRNGTGGSVSTGGTGTHTGGNTGNGGTGNTGVGNTTGSTGGSSSSGTGGTGSTATSCVDGETNPPSMMLITDFSDAVASSGGNYNFGSSKGQLGGTALFPAGMGMLTTGSGGLTYKGTVPAPTASNMYPNAGVVVFINGPGCVNASAYTGVSFTISGSGTCNVVFAFGDKEHTAKSDDAMRGTCTASPCYAGQFTLTVASAPTSVKMPFSGTPTNPGSPATMVDTMNVTGVQFQLGQASTATTSCMETLTITNVSFY